MNPFASSGQPSQKRRVLLAARYLWGYEGVSLQLRSLAGRLQDEGWSVGLVTGTDLERREQYDTLRWFDDNLHHYFVPFPQKLDWSKGMQFLKAFQKLNRVVRAFSPDVIHAHSLSLTPYFYLLRYMHRIPLVSTVHSQPSLERKDIKIGAAVNRWLPNFLGDKMIAISSDLATSFIEDLNVAPNRIRVVYHGIDQEYFRPPTREERREARGSFDIESEDLVVCLVGQLEPVKAHRVLLDAIALLKERRISAHVICAGEGTLKTKLKEYAQSTGTASLIRFPGFVDARAVYWASDIKVLPSYREGFALVVPEAMLCGLPVIRTPTAGAKDQIEDGFNGFIIPFDSPDVLADRIHQLIADSAQRASMAENARAISMKRFSIDESINQVQSVYHSV
jgi:glycosyltransferase involved in cell wall biosynthesis